MDRRLPQYSPPIVDWFGANKTIIIRTSCSGTVDIEAANFTDYKRMWNGSWEKIDSIILNKN